MQLHSINTAQRIYVMPCGPGGFTCYGFDVLDRKARAVAAWSNVVPPLAEPSTADHFEQCAAILDHGQRHAASTRTQCPADLTPALQGLEGRRVEVTHLGGTRERFTVGRSIGWMPCHLAIHDRRSWGGEAAYFPTGSTVRTI